ncbi:uncharacterized protein LOC131680369 [Topomyia yanbarensis]|uniref:uncharacterized protein LOC131680369 n=1 Tax=Topomyia yanbarensis TaxID=2498891 RepID=UPI00273B4E77|nr:uncharacterized protein LOC131680369 [Topomyia yanbarensis]
MENNGDDTVYLLNRSQLAARHAVPKDLPEFSGQAEEWPLFLAMFNSSTQMCGFSNEENMLQPRKCLRGEALNRVRCELLHPSNVTASPKRSSKRKRLEPEATTSDSLSSITHDGNLEHSVNIHQARNSGVLFRFVPVVLYGPSKEVHTYAFVNDGSELTLLEQGLADELGVSGQIAPLCLKWTGGTKRVECESQKVSMHASGLPIESYYDTASRILIGVDHAKLGHVTKSRKGKTKEPVAVKTCLGWCVYGYIEQSSSSTSVVNHHMLDIYPCNQENCEYLHKAMKEYFPLDSMGAVKPEKFLVSTEDARALQMLDTLTPRKGDRYESGLLWKYDGVRPPNNKTMALKHWECLEHRMQNDLALAEVLNTKIANYISKGYIRKLTDAELTIKHPRIWYLPVFLLLTRISLLRQGCVLIQFREHRITVCGNLRGMYTQVLMREEEQHSQRFFWGREESLAKPTVYVMQVMTFGACCSPSTAQYVKNRHAKLYANKFPASVHAIVKQHYVDDMIISVETEEEAISIVSDVKMIQLRDEKLAVEFTYEKILGMWWDTEKDCFTFKLSTKCSEDLLSGRRRPTKREALRMLMLMYDPCGFIAHFLIYLKVLLQDIWRSGIGWNDKIGENDFEKCLLWVKVLPKIEDVEIPRCFRNLTTVDVEIQLHTFIDASENGFAAAVYLRFCEGTKIECALVAAKTRVAPLRFLSIPRAELQAAVLGVRLTNAVQSALSLKVRRRFFYTDARDVCSDLGSKWKGFPDLSPQGPWFHGSSFLSTYEEEWPITSQRYETTDEELRPHLLTHIVAPEPLIAPEKYSNWMTLLRRTAMFTRQAFNWRRLAKKEQPLSVPLTHDELKKTENYLYRIAQADASPLL